ncbi:MAG: hypothetical protein ACLP9L_22125 [Thermoguttaceae bacterium]
MRLWTIFAGLAVAGIMSGSLYAQDGGGQGGQGRGGRGGMFMQVLKWSDFTFTTAPANADEAALNQAIYEAAALKKLPEGVDQDRAKTRIDANFIAIAKGAGVTDPTPETKISKNQYNEGVVNMMSQRGGRGPGKKKKSAEST